jgi:hypothetical protein
MVWCSGKWSGEERQKKLGVRLKLFWMPRQSLYDRTSWKWTDVMPSVQSDFSRRLKRRLLQMKRKGRRPT